MFDWLDVAMYYGIEERSYWDMTIGEVSRAIDIKKRQQKAQAQEKACFDYILADLIGRSYARIHSSANDMPHISKVYPSLFDEEETVAKESEIKAQLSAARFKQFADAYNKRYKGGVKANE